MNSMVDQLARVIQANIVNGWQQLPEARKAAVAVLSALREPTADMARVGSYAMSDLEYIAQGDATEVWQAMIDEALK